MEIQPERSEGLIRDTTRIQPERSESSVRTLLDIPPEIMNLIYDKLNLQTLLSFVKVNKHFNETISIFMKIIKYCEKNRTIDLHPDQHDKFLSLISQHIDYILTVKKYVLHLNMIDVCSRFGRNDKLLELKKKFPEIKGTSEAFNWASENGDLVITRSEPSLRSG